MFPINSLKENVLLYFWNTARANTVLSITAKPVHRASIGESAETMISVLQT